MDNNLKLMGEKANTKSTQAGKELWGSEWGGPFVGYRLKFSHFVGSQLKFRSLSVIGKSQLIIIKNAC